MIKLPICYMEKIKNKKGFTLIELLVVMAIIAMVSVLAIIGLLRFRSSIKVSNAANELVENLRRARRMAVDNVGSKDAGAEMVLDGYIFDLDTSTENYSIYAKAGSNLYPEYENLKSPQYDVDFESTCGDIYFEQVTGIFTNNCEVQITSQNNFISTSRTVVINGSEQTIKVN